MPKRPHKAPDVAFSNLGKIFFPKTRFTKGDVIKYYLDVAPVLLPHFRDRPVTLIRFPDGVHGEKFFEKNAPGHTPRWVRTTDVARTDGGVIHYIVVDDARTLAWCANLAAIELHPFLHRAGEIQQPTHLAFDLDPGEGADLLTCVEVGFMVREVLAGLGLDAFAKVSGSKGLQLYVPLNTPVTYQTVTPFAKAIAELLHRQHPDLIVSDMSKALRVRKVLIDWSQNHEKKTTVGAYSLRAKHEQPFVSTPVTWEELKTAAKKGDKDRLFFTPKDVLKRVQKHGDLFAPVLKLRQKLPREFVGVATVENVERTAPPAAKRGRSSSSKGRSSSSARRTSRSAAKRTPKALQAYAAKRDFNATAEPSPDLPKASAQGSRRRFVIQKHAASHLHYDFRLEMDGVLKSWAVPKGLSTEVGVKRSAFQVEDHPLDYFSFEGTIPQGQYGGGTVMVWDIGTYDLIDGRYDRGDLKLWLSGKKLKGEWHMFRIKSPDEKPVWLIQKAKEPAKAPTVKQLNTSVLTGRTMEQIAAGGDAVWQSKGAAWESGRVRPKRGKSAPLPPEPQFVAPMLAREVKELTPSDHWTYEIKWDGYRVLALKHGDTVRLLSRKNNDLTKDFPDVVDAVRKINASSALLDGEVVALDSKGRPSFQMLQHRAAKEGVIAYYAYDLLNVEGEDWRDRPLDERKARLAEVVAGSGVAFSASLDGELDDIIASLRQLGMEGIVAKRKDSTYKSGERSGGWTKLKFSPAQEFVIGGFKRGRPLESLVVGFYEGDRLICAGKVRQGLNPVIRRELYAALKPLSSDVCPFANLPNSKKSHWGEGITRDQMVEIQWVVPKIIAQISFAEWTRGGALRHGTYQGLRADKAPAEVVRES